ncbi:MAG: TrmH family RNA methyltransferase [Spirochaetaceae bacterium]|jgi:TrmH family RNA methyltransferase|nr:TrmH family RNA methyltransferase [Spirochaetaceae bacterium]
MIPLDKLKKLPRTLRLRKAAKLIQEAEYHARGDGGPSGPERAYWAELLGILREDPLFSPAEIEALRDAEALLRGLVSPDPLPGTDTQGPLYRALNSVRYILLAKTGRFPADWDLVDPEGRLDPQKRLSFPGVRIYLEDIRSPFNVGAIFRTAESFGAEKLYLSPLCADPLHPRAARTAMGCVAILPWERLSRGLVDSDPAGPFFALETGGKGLKNFPFPPRGIMILGSEELGVSPESLALADASLGRLSIPTYGAKGSLNVSVAFGIAMQAWAAALQTH